MLIVDDVYTTGKSMRDAKLELELEGHALNRLHLWDTSWDKWNSLTLRHAVFSAFRCRKSSRRRAIADDAFEAPGLLVFRPGPRLLVFRPAAVCRVPRRQ